MAVVLATVKKLVNAQLNIVSSYSETPDDPAFYEDQIRDAILSADMAVCCQICNNPSHRFRPNFFASANVPHGGIVPVGDGPIESVIIGGRGAIPYDKDEIEAERANVLGLTKISPHYVIEGSTIYHNATTPLFGITTATVQYSRVIKGSVCQAPDCYEFAVACGALFFLFPSEGDNLSAGGHYGQQWMAYLKMIEAGISVVPGIMPYGGPQQ